mmetsp:Transcript_141808/g.369685  ORF Transcript_141808/g.369685 Transcript_141808/m.369685 type:complete len:87 (-) Transcript_141808:40-300(-)
MTPMPKHHGNHATCSAQSHRMLDIPHLVLYFLVLLILPFFQQGRQGRLLHSHKVLIMALGALLARHLVLKAAHCRLSSQGPFSQLL